MLFLMQLIRKKNNIFQTQNLRNTRIGWCGGSSHLHDLQKLAGVATKLKSDNLLDKVQLVLCGYDLRGTMTVIDQVTKQQTQRPIKPTKVFWYEYEKYLLTIIKLLVRI